MRVVYFGSGAFGLPTLQRLLERHEVVAVVTQPDRPSGRGGRTTPTPIGAFLAEHCAKVPVFKPEKVNRPEIIEQIRDFPADAWVVIAYGQKLPASLLHDRFAINLHASHLPRWRGAAPINAAILAGDTVTGNSVITLADRMDAGLILGQSLRPIPPQQTAGELHDLLSSDGPDLVEHVLEQHRTNTLHPITQDESLVTIAGKLSREDDSFDTDQPADFLRRQIHALTPWPGISIAFRPSPASPPPLTVITGKVGRAATHTSASGNTTHAHGSLIDPDLGLVACGHGTVLQLIEFQPAGKRMMPWGDFRRGGGRTLNNQTEVVSARELEP